MFYNKPRKHQSKKHAGLPINSWTSQRFHLGFQSRPCDTFQNSFAARWHTEKSHSISFVTDRSASPGSRAFPAFQGTGRAGPDGLRQPRRALAARPTAPPSGQARHRRSHACPQRNPRPPTAAPQRQHRGTAVPAPQDSSSVLPIAPRGRHVHSARRQVRRRMSSARSPSRPASSWPRGGHTPVTSPVPRVRSEHSAGAVAAPGDCSATGACAERTAGGATRCREQAGMGTRGRRGAAERRGLGGAVRSGAERSRQHSPAEQPGRQSQPCRDQRR